MVMHLRATHAHAGLLWWCSHAGRLGNTGRSRSIWPGHVIAMRNCSCLSVVHFSHPPHSSTPEAWILVAVTPAVDSPLNQATLTTQARVELRQGPTDGVAFRLVVQAITFVLLFVATCARVDAVLGLEVLRKLIDVDGLDITTDRVFHLDAIATVFKRNPLHTILILAHHQRGSGGDGPRSSVGVDVCCWRGPVVHAGSSDWRCLRRCLRWAKSRRWSLKRRLRHARLGASGHARGLRMRLVGVRVVHLLALLMGHEERVCRHWLLLLLCRWVLGIRRLLWNCRRRVRRVVHGLRHLAGGLAVDGPAMLIMLRRLHRRGRVGLRRVVGDWRESRPVHGRGSHELWGFCGWISFP